VVLDAVVDLQESASRTRMFWEADPNARGRNGGVRQELAAGVKKAAGRPAAEATRRDLGALRGPPGCGGLSGRELPDVLPCKGKDDHCHNRQQAQLSPQVVG